MNTEFEISVVSNFLVQKGGPVRHQKPAKHFQGISTFRQQSLRSFSSPPRIPSEKKFTSKMGQNFVYFHRKFEIDVNKNETSSKPGSFRIKTVYFQLALGSPPLSLTKKRNRRKQSNRLKLILRSLCCNSSIFWHFQQAITLLVIPSLLTEPFLSFKGISTIICNLTLDALPNSWEIMGIHFLQATNINSKLKLIQNYIQFNAALNIWAQ